MKTQIIRVSNEDVIKVKELIKSNGFDCINDIVNSTGVELKNIIIIIKQEGLQLNLSLENLVSEGVLSLREMATVTNSGCYEAIRKRIIRKGLYNDWIIKRNHLLQEQQKQRNLEAELNQERTQLLEEIFYQINNTLKKRLINGDQGFYYQQALYYCSEHSLFRLNFQDIVEFLRRYHNCKDKNVKKTLNELTEGLAICGATAGRILELLKLKPLYGNKQRNFQLTQKLEERVQKAFYAELPIRDLAYFLEIPLYYLDKKFKQIGERKQYGLKVLYHKQSFPYRLLSHIFMAQDAGYTNEEMTKEFKIEINALDNLKSKRKIIQKSIINELRKIYGNKINKPYIA